MNASVIVLFALVAAAAAQFQQAPAAYRIVPILKQQEVRDDAGQYSYSYETGDGAAHSDHGYLKPGPEGYVLARQGSHAYTAPNGRVITLTYTADENGYHPSGDHLPVAPAPIV